MATRKLFVLTNHVWDADDYAHGCNCDPVRTDTYLYATREECEQKAQALDVSDDIYNDAVVYEGELEESEILELTGYETIDEFNEALAEPYSTEPRVKNLGEDEKGEVAEAIMDNPTFEQSIDCANYDFDKPLDGCILVFWSWHRYIGYARKFIELRRAYSGDTERMLIKQDKVVATQCDVLLTAAEVEAADDLQAAIRDALARDSWKWTNPGAAEREAETF